MAGKADRKQARRTLASLFAGTSPFTWFRGGLVFKAHRLCVPLNCRLESNRFTEEASNAGVPPLSPVDDAELERGRGQADPDPALGGRGTDLCGTGQLAD